MNLKKYEALISKKEMPKIYFLFFSSILVVFFEMLGIGSVPVLAYILVDPENSILNIKDKFEMFGASPIELDKKYWIILSGVLFVFIFFIKNLSIVLIKYYELKVMRILREKISKKVFFNYLNSPYSFFVNTNPSYVLRTVHSDIAESFSYLLAKIRLYREVMLVFIMLVVLISIEPLVYSSTFGIFTLIALIFYFFYKRILSERSKIEMKKNKLKFQMLNQTFNSIKEIKIFNKSDYFIKKFNDNITILEKINLITSFVSQLPRIVYEMMAILMIIIFTVFLILLDKPQNTIFPIISLLVASGARFIPAFNQISSSMGVIRYTKPKFKNVLSVLKDMNKKNENLLTTENIENPKKLKFNNLLEIKNLSFEFGNKKILDNVSFKIEKGSIVGIIGQSGEGKSTLLNLILGLLKPSNGEILVDEININQDIKNWQKKIGFISQDIYLLDDSIKTNICFGIDKNQIDEERFQKCLELAQIKTFVTSLENKENTTIGNLGSKISGGQRQRIAIARALYVEPEVIILDEGTSSLDIENENKIISDLNIIKKEKTIIIVSHRKNTLVNCNKIFSLKDKRINPIN